MFTQSLKPLATVLVAAGFWLASGTVRAQVVNNGSLTGPIANASVPDGWNSINGTPDTMDANNNVGVSGLQDFGAAPSASPDGGTWVGIGSEAGFIETFGQTVTGLTLGTHYAVTWSNGNFGVESLGYVNPNSVKVLLDGVSIGTGATRALSSNWYQESLNFTATSPTANLVFELATDAKSYMSIDGIAVNPVPEPETWALMMVGMSFVAQRAITRRSRKASVLS